MALRIRLGKTDKWIGVADEDPAKATDSPSEARTWPTQQVCEDAAQRIMTRYGFDVCSLFVIEAAY